MELMRLESANGVKSAIDSCVAWHGGRVGRPLHYNFAREKSLSSTSPNQPVHLTPEARAFFAFAISEQTSLLPSHYWLLVQVTSTNPAVRIKAEDDVLI